MPPLLFLEKTLPNQPSEQELGNREYKWKLLNRAKVHKLASQMSFRLHEGDGKALYLIGISDKGKSCGISREQLQESLTNLETSCYILDQSTLPGTQIEKIRVYLGSEPNSFVATVRIRTVKM